MKRDPEKLVTVALAEPGKPGDPPTVIFGIPKGAWEFMQGGLTHTFDLSSQGIPLQVILFGAESRGAVLDLMEKAAGSLTGHENLADLGIKDPLK